MSTQTNSKPVPEGPKLPQELFNMIIDESRDNKASLLQLSLVCRSFCQQARCHLLFSGQITCGLPSEPYRYEHNEVDSSPNHKPLMLVEFIRLCESPLSTWSPRVVKKLEISSPNNDGLPMLLPVSDDPEELLRNTANLLDTPRTRDIFGSLDSLQLSFADLSNWHRIGVLPYEVISMRFPSIRRLSLKFVQLSAIDDLWYILISVPLLEEFEWICGTFRSWPPTFRDILLTRPLPKLRSLSYQGSEDISLGDFDLILSLPLSHISRYEFGIAHRDDFPAIAALMRAAGREGPAKQQWTFSFLPSASRHCTGAYPFESDEDLNFVSSTLCLIPNDRISELTFGNGCPWPIIPEVLGRFACLSWYKSNLKSITLPPFMVDKWCPGYSILLEMEVIDKILDRDAFAGLQELHLHAFRYPGSHGDGPPDMTWPLDEKTRNARWGRFEPMLEDIEGRCVSRAVKKGIWKLHTVGKEWYDD